MGVCGAAGGQSESKMYNRVVELPRSLLSRRSVLMASAGAAGAWNAAAASPEKRELAGLTVRKASELLRARRVSPVELTQACLERIQKYNPSLNAFITVTAEQALASAREREAEIAASKWRGPFHGIPIALKDNIDTAGVRTTAASGVFQDRVPAEDAEVARRLKKAGAVLLGKLNLHEFAMGGSSAVSYFGPVHNPWALDRTPGGSSGGPAAAVAADLCFASLGTDTAGSIRIPAGYCSIVGLKPTYGRVSIRGVIPLAWTLDHVGPMCKTVEDAALMLEVIAGYDEGDSTTADVPVTAYARSLRTATAKWRLGVAREPFFDKLNPDVAKAMEEAIQVLRKLTASVEEIRLPQPSNVLPTLTAEAYAYHAEWITKTPERYQPTTRASLRRAAEVRGPDYARARREVDQWRREIKKVFTGVDLIITPTSPEPPVTIEEVGTRIVSARNTLPFDIFGIPTIDVPCGFSASGLPIGMQISGPPFGETSVLALAHAYEQATEWHRKRPALV
jgi:aspartyl-tRNA(Asn)/glutamyl-tRNA(Gln) amidotransferase subunit A